MDNGQTWHDLAADLTPVEIATLQRLEHEADPDDPCASTLLLDLARDMVWHHLAAIQYADVPVPTGTTAGRWEISDDGWVREVVRAHRPVDDALAVRVGGSQGSDGSVAMAVTVLRDGVPVIRGLSAADATALADALNRAAHAMRADPRRGQYRDR